VDFALVVILIEGYEIRPWLATALGCLLGAVISFTINGIWSFNTGDSHFVQIGRYSIVGAVSALLNSGGVSVLLLLPLLDYRIAWPIVRCAVFLAWNFPLHKDYVFSQRRQG
jgi:putative flippase GtrA